MGTAERFTQLSLDLYKYFLHSGDTQQANNANKELVVLINSPGILDILGQVLSGETSNEPILAALFALDRILLSKWTFIPKNTKLSIFQTLLAMLVNKGPELPHFVLTEICNKLCRMVRQYWNENEEFPKLLSYSDELIRQGGCYSSIGLKIMKDLLVEMKPQAECKLLQHQRNSDDFKKNYVHLIYGVGSRLLREALETQTNDLAGEALFVMNEALGFEVLEDECNSVTLNNKSDPNWSNLHNVQVIPNVFSLFLHFVKGKEYQFASSCLRYFSLVILLKKEYFDLSVRHGIIIEILKGIDQIMAEQLQLRNELLYHHFSKLIANLAISSSLVELPVDISGLFEQIYRCLVEAMKINDTLTMSYHLMNFWGNLCYTHSEVLATYSLRIAKEYIDFAVSCREAPESWEVLQSELSVLLPVSKPSFPDVASYSIAKLESEILSVVNSAGSIERVVRMISIFAVLIVHDKNLHQKLMKSKGTIIMNIERTIEEYRIQGNLVFCVLKTFDLIEANPVLQESRMICGCLLFLQNCIQIFLRRNSKGPVQELFQSIATQLSLEDPNEVLSHIIRKIFLYLSQPNEETYEICMTLFFHLIDNGFTYNGLFFCGSLVLGIQHIEEIISSYSQCTLPFMAPNILNKSRLLFSAAASKLFFYLKYIQETPFEYLVSGTLRNIKVLLETNSLTLLQCICYDLRGILFSITNSTNFSIFFQWFHPNISSILESYITPSYSNIDSFYALIKLIRDLSFNKISRHCFAPESSTGVSLFKLCETFIKKILCDLLANPPTEEKFKYSYKPISILVTTFTNTISGSCLKPATLRYLKGQSLDQTFCVILTTITTIQLEDLITYHKYFTCIFTLLNYITSKLEFITYFYTLPHEYIENTLKVLLETCQSLILNISLLTHSIVKSLTFNLSTNLNSEFIEIHKGTLYELLRTYFSFIVKGEIKNISYIAEALLGLINIQQHAYSALEESLRLRSPQLQVLFTQLWENAAFKWSRDPKDLERNLQFSRGFTTRLTYFVNMLVSL